MNASIFHAFWSIYLNINDGFLSKLLRNVGKYLRCWGNLLYLRNYN